MQGASEFIHYGTVALAVGLTSISVALEKGLPVLLR